MSCLFAIIEINYNLEGDILNNNKKVEKNFSLKKVINATVSQSNEELVQKYGSAVKEHIVGYTGVDNETGKILTRSLKSVSKSKVNPEYAYQNLKQQSGFSAEVVETNRANEERIIEGRKTRIYRTDDLGRVNDPLYDHVEIDSNGTIISGSGSQMKFVGKSPTDCLNKLMSVKYKKYRDNNVSYEVPSDFYDEIQKDIDQRINKLKIQMQKAEIKGDPNFVQKQQNNINELKNIKKNMKKSHLSNKEAMEARVSPKLFTVKEVHRVSHNAGMEGAKSGAIIGGGIATVQNIVDVIKGKKSFDEAVVDISKTTAISAGTGYLTTYGSTALKGYMQNCSTNLVRSLSKTNIPVVMATTVVSSVKSITKYFSGEISGTECLKNIGKTGASTITSMTYGAVGQCLIPVPIVGAMVGSMIGYTLCSLCYGNLINALNKAKLAKEERIRVEKECEEAIRVIRAYRKEMNEYMDRYLSDYRKAFNNAFLDIKTALSIGDIDGCIDGFNQITRKLGGHVEFNNMEEFNKRMEDSSPFIL